MKTAIDLIQEECDRQVYEHNYTADHDDKLVNGELALAAMCYLIPLDRDEIVFETMGDTQSVSIIDEFWPWSGDSFKYKDQKTNLIRAAAMLQKELDRIIRIENKTQIQ